MSGFCQSSSVPAASAVVATAEDEDDQKDDQKGGKIHGSLLRIYATTAGDLRP